MLLYLYIVLATRMGPVRCTSGVLFLLSSSSLHLWPPTCAMVELSSPGVDYQLATTPASTSRWVTLWESRKSTCICRNPFPFLAMLASPTHAPGNCFPPYSFSYRWIAPLSKGPRIASRISAIKHTCLLVAGPSSPAPPALEHVAAYPPRLHHPLLLQPLSALDLFCALREPSIPRNQPRQPSSFLVCPYPGISISALPATSVCPARPLSTLGWARLHSPGICTRTHRRAP